MDAVQTPQCPELKLFIKQLGKGINYQKIGAEIIVGAPTGCEKGNSAGAVPKYYLWI